MDDQRFYDLVHLFLSKQLNEEEHAELSAMLKADVERALIFQELTSTKKIVVPANELEKRFQQIVDSPLHPEETIETPVVAIKKHGYLKYAAVLLIFLLAAGLIYRYYGSSKAASYAVFMETKNGERKEITLPDGTHIWLNGGSKLAYKHSFGKEDRDIRLEGEAFFDVAHNKSLPMYVEAKNMVIKVVGTSFNVRSYPDEANTETCLVDGIIELYVNKNLKHGEPIHVVPGEKIKIQAQEAEAETAKEEVAVVQPEKLKIQKSQFLKKDPSIQPSEIAWKDNTLAFDAEPLAVIISKLEKWYNIPIVLKNKALAENLVSGSFKDTDIETVLFWIKESGLNLNYTINNNQITIY